MSFWIAGLHLTVSNQRKASAASPKRKEKGRRRRNQRSKCFSKLWHFLWICLFMASKEGCINAFLFIAELNRIRQCLVVPVVLLTLVITKRKRRRRRRKERSKYFSKLLHQASHYLILNAINTCTVLINLLFYFLQNWFRFNNFY